MAEVGIQQPPGAKNALGELKFLFPNSHNIYMHDTPMRELFQNAIGKKAASGYFDSEVLEPLKVKGMLDRDVSTLSGGELQRVAIALCLGRDADIYLIDEPSAYLDSEQRLVCAKVIKRFILHAKKTALVARRGSRLAGFLVRRVLTAGRAELAQFNSIWVVTTVLAGDVVASFAIATCHGDFRTDIRLFCHSNLLALLGHIPRLRNMLRLFRVST